VRNEDELIEVLKISWVKERKPVVSDKLRKKIEEAVEHVKKGEKVCIVGDAGIGKTTALYLACLHLMNEGIKLRISGIEGEGVLVVDDIGAKENLLKKLEICTTPVIASARKSEWKSPRRWHEIRIEPEDQRPKLREMFISMLKANNVRYKEEAVDEIVKRDPTPIFLSTIAEDFKEKEMDIKDVSRIPKDLYEYIAEVIKDCEDDLAVALLYCVAKTRTGWLHFRQLNILRRKLSGDFKGDGKYERLLAEFYGSYGIKHDVWRDLITMDRERVPKDILSSVEEMDAIKRIRGYDVRELTREACKESLNYIKIMKASEAANLAKRALENFPDLSEYAFRIALEAREDKRDFILDVIAIEAPDPLMRIEIDEAEKLAYGIMRSPNAEIVLFGRLYSRYRDLAERDEKYLPDLAAILNNLGNALYSKGMLDEAMERYDEALKIRRDLAEKDERFLPDLADTLINLGNALSDKEMLDEAVDKLEEALKIYRDLSEKDERFLPDLAAILNNLGNALYSKGMLDEAIERYEEVLKIHRDLAEKDERFLPDLADTLINLGNALSDKEMLDEAVDKLEEALKIYRDLSEKDERFLPDLARTLNNLGNALSKKEMLDEAVDKLEEALKIYRDLSEKDERFLPYLAAILINLGNALSKKEMFDEAVEHLCAALKMLTDERAPKTPISEKLLEICISHLKKILEELIPEECRKKLVDILHRQS